MVTTMQWYYEETTNFRRQLEAIAYTDRADSAVPMTQEPDSLPADTVESPLGSEITSATELENHPINEVGALYLPVQGEEIALLAPQLAAVGFKRTLIGDAICLDLVGREAVKRYVADMVFPASFASNLGFDLESDFAHLYQTKMGAWPDRWSLLGWDAFNFLSQGLKDTGKISRVKLAMRLSAVRKFTGVRGEVVFPPNRRVNHSLYLLNYVEGQLGLVRSPQQVAQDLMHE
jgi:ABC-type branched-subunit amino acid transport system substrate-binding protein